MKGCDSFGAIDGATAQAVGIGFACRYLWATGPAQKGITAAEAADLRAHGLLIVLNYEGGTQDADTGYQGGQNAARAANAYADAIAAPHAAWIYYSDDQNNTEAATQAYYQGIASIPGRPAGAYGGDAAKGIWQAGLAHGWWQSMSRAWSTTYPDPTALIVQGGTGTVGGTQVDYDTAQATFFGAWGQEGSPFMALTDAQIDDLYAKVVAIYQVLYATDAAKDPNGAPIDDHWAIGYVKGDTDQILAMLKAAQPPVGLSLSTADVQAVAEAVIARLAAHLTTTT